MVYLLQLLSGGVYSGQLPGQPVDHPASNVLGIVRRVLFLLQDRYFPKKKRDRQLPGQGVWQVREGGQGQGLFPLKTDGVSVAPNIS